MMGAALPHGSCAARLMLFVGGPSTEGTGKVVDRELSEPIRSHEACIPPPFTPKS
jgi:protein transport protein SEC23